MKANFSLNKLSLPAKLTLGFFLVGVLTISMTAVSMFLISRNNLHGEIRKQLQNYVQLAALQIDGDTFESWRDAKDMQSPAYQAEVVRLRAALKETPDIVDIYGLRGQPDGKITFIIDPILENAAQLGEEYASPGPALAANFSKATAAFTETDFYTDKWGTWLSGYAPIRKADGTIVGILAADFSAQGVQNEEDTALRTLIGSVLVSILLMALATFLLSRSLLSPLPYLTRIAGLVAEGKIPDQKDDQQKMACFRERQDEIGAFARQFSNLTDYFAQMAGAAQRIADGDLSDEVKPRSSADTLGQAFLRMSANLRELIGQVAENATGLTSAAAQLASASGQAGQATSQISATIQQVAAGIGQQTESATRTAGSVDDMGRSIDRVARGAQKQSVAVGQASAVTSEISAAIQQVAASAETSAKGASQAAETARSGAKTVEGTIRGMKTIKAKVGLSAVKVQEMGDRSDKIGAIVETIDDIASQTNLLALNAAIEAARAGEHGKGFAVVADEVRKLAERSSSATKEIGKLIRDIQQTMKDAMAAMDESTREVESGVEHANQADEALSGILSAIEIVKEQVEQIASASQHINASSGDLVAAVDSVLVVVEENRAVTQQMLANSSVVTPPTM